MTARELPAPVTRRTFVAGALATTGAAAVATVAAPPGTAHAAALPSLSAPGIRVDALADGTIVVRDDAGTERVRLTHFMVKDMVVGQQRTYGGTPSAVTLPDGRPAIQVEYRLTAAADGITVRGVFDVSPLRAHLRWDATSPRGLSLNSQLARVPAGSTGPYTTTALVRWQRDAGGGVPFETNDGIVYTEPLAGTAAHFRFGTTNPAWSSATWLHVEGVPGDDGVLVHEGDLVLGDLSPTAAGTVATGRPVGVELVHDRAFGLSTDASAPLIVRAHVVQGAPTAGPVTLAWEARDFDGDVVAQGTGTRTLEPGASWQEAVEVPAPEHGIVFVEVRATSAGGEDFARTTLSVLPRHDYAGTGRIGIANYPWLLEPSKQDVAELLTLLGVASVRIAYEGAPGIPPAELEAMGIMPNIQHGDVVFGATPEEAQQWAAELVDVVVGARARYFEVDNERNQPWMSGRYTLEYVRDGLRPAVERLREVGGTAKVMNCGLGGMDVNWVDGFHAAGGWDLIDAFAFHPGRGNFVPDYAPTPDEWVTGDTGSYWNFLGALREARRRVDLYGGDKELWLTEAYACTRPNRWWNDTMRQAAENTLLQLALAMSEGVDGVNWYQLHDSIIHRPQQAMPTNAEYHFGLMNRDTSAKPSLLAFATATRLLEGATFVRWLDLSAQDPDLRGLLFDTPEGPMSVRWSRADGYLLNADHGADAYHPHPEAWEDGWPTKTDVSFQGSREVVEVDCIGRRRTITGSGGTVTVRLDGAPRVYLGLSARPEKNVAACRRAGATDES